ncbi:DNA oxidative demethylase ALKBH2-like isoform X3 [Atheta coriaria]|uniref:DNA oxidative demethylase ALKBH2-like isoform X3 n=1 Tax=Dalotia coriaria TaxID=877792 RepID=UPI0031F4610A
MRTENNLICDVNKQHKTMSASLLQEIEKIDAIKWHTIDGEQLNLSYASLFHKDLADRIFTELETSTEYYDADMCKVRVFGKYHNIPRKQVAHSDPDLVYRFSGSVVPGKPWTPLLAAIRDRVQHLTGGVRYNFVLINSWQHCFLTVVCDNTNIIVTDRLVACGWSAVNVQIVTPMHFCALVKNKKLNNTRYTTFKLIYVLNVTFAINFKTI